jgi:elongation factor Ts
MASSLIEKIKVLRERTGAGMMDCKAALLANNEDVEASIDWLREKGIAKVAKKSSRIAAEGLTTVKVSGDDAVVLEVNSETDFVAGSPAFKELVDTVATKTLADKPADISAAKEDLAQLFTDATVKIGEKLDYRRFELVSKTSSQFIGSYIHMGGKISVLVLLEGGSQELANGLAMHIAANNPLYVTEADIPGDAIEAETKVQTEAAKNDPKLAGKPEQALAKIIEGKVNKHFAESVLLKQEYLLDPKPISQALKEANASVVKFIRFQVGEGIEKRQDNFAEEVAKQMK